MQQITQDQIELPQELTVKPLALVGISGLDTLNNAVHKAVWDTFTSNRRVERAHVQFKLIDNAHEFPVVKPKRNSYEWYIPKGILKRNWMTKHLNEIPAIIAIFYDLDWNDTQWNEKVIECASRVQSMRAALDGRSTRVVVVLIQSSAMPAGEDMIASEKATALCASCELNAKSLLVLPHVDHLQGYAVRLENAFYDFAQNYYHVEARNIKSHREHLNKTTHQYLFVRHQFKMGFLNELKQDIHTAHKYNIFGDIFDEAVKLGLPAVQTQHPGLYYQQAAQYAILRRQSCKELCSNIKTYPTPDPLQGTNILEFYGQRPWRPGKLSAEPPNPQLEQNGIMALQFSEQHVNHSNAIITLYGLAITQYKAYRCPRTRRHLIVQMADEYFITKDYGKALTLLTHMLWDYRSEKWWNIISSILLKALKCAYLTANLQDYIILTMEALGGHISIDEEKKKKMYENLYNVLNRQLPEPESDLPPLCVQSAISQWQQILTSQSLQFSLEMGEMVSSIDCRARFVKTEYEADENVSVEIYLKSLCLFPMHFLRISVTINMAGLNSEYVVDSGNVNHIVLNSNEIKWFRVTFRPDPINVDKEIQINGIQLQIGNNANNCIINLKFSGQGNNLNKTFAELQHFRNNHRNMPDFDNITTQLTTNIVPRHSKLDLLFQHANPALLDEWYEINVNIKNNENRNIRDIRFEVSLVDDDGIDSIPGGQLRMAVGHISATVYSTASEKYP
ncbi:hypothetical protein MML48_5g00016715 [Holotrichia oblita]|uniref:Uncharacterized protein n=2 Tax=Holotrichia oblita TaxID=644536 RepID=A0ACB9T416_HOLOL|nr:hypothetical protein MML48_5g00016715 [Holotrichia oblita]